MVPVGGNRTLRTASRRNSGAIPMSAARSSNRRKRSWNNSDFDFPESSSGFWKCESASPGPHQSSLELYSFHSCQIFRECSVNRFSRGNPIATAKRSAPSPTSMTWPVCNMTALATSETFLMLRTPPTEPARRDGPCIQQESSSTTPSSFGSPPRPTLVSFGSSSGPLTTRSAASSVSPPLLRMA